jgi:hypothetical protein
MYFQTMAEERFLSGGVGVFTNVQATGSGDTRGDYASR